MESKRTETTYFIPPGKFLLMENALGNPDLIQSSVSSDCRVTIVDLENFPLDDLEQWPTFRLISADIKLKLGEGKYYIYIVVPTPDNTEATSAFISYNTVKVDRKGYGEDGTLLGKAGFRYYPCGTVSARGGNPSATTTPSGQGRLIEMDLGVTPAPSTLPGNLNDFDKIFQIEKVDKNNPKSWLLTILTVVKEMTARVIRVTGSLVFGSGESEKPVAGVATAEDKENEEVINDTTIATTAWVSEKFSEISDDRYLRKDQPDRTPFDLAVGGTLSAEKSILFQEKQISGFIRKFDNPRPEVVTDADFYSALMTDERIEEELRNLDDRYLRKDKEDTAHKHITFEEGIDVYKLAKMMNLEVTELATIAEAVVNILRSSKFVDGFFGEGYQIWKSIATGDWCMTLDRLTVRKVMSVYELIIQKIRSVGGMIAVSAGNGKIKEVEQVGLEYKFTFEDENTFQVNDLMRCQVWTGTGVKSYWVEVTRVDGEAVYTRVADYNGVMPDVGDEVVLMGNTKNKLRQGLVLISAAEDGQPRVDVLDGVRTTNFDGCLKARVGGLDGIRDSRFPSDMQPKGYGLYGNNCYLTGVFVLSNGKDVQTQFAIIEGMIRANMSSVQQQINAEDNYLRNASMTTNLSGWEYDNDVKVFRTSGGLLHFNGNFYAIKNNFAGIVPSGEKSVLQLKNSFIRQRNADFAKHPTFGLVEQTTTDAEGNEVGTGVKLYRPKMFYVSFRYMVTRRGTLRVYFENEEEKSDFEPYTKLDYTKVLEAGSEFVITDDTIAGKWNGTGDFHLSFDGDMYLYDLALADDPLSDMEERWNMKFELTEKRLALTFEHLKQQGEDLEEYRSEYLRTAEQIRSEFAQLVQNTEEDITEEYTGLVTQTAQKLESDYNAKFGDYYGEITEEYNSKITQTAKDITATLTARIDNTDKDLADTEAALIKDYTAKISASAETLSSDYNAKITDLRTGDIADMKSSIVQNANQIATKVSQTNFEALTQRVVKAESSITQNASEITLMVRKDGVISAINQSAESVTINANRLNLLGAVTFLSLSQEVWNEIDGKAESSELESLEDDLNRSISSLNSTISGLQTEVSKKASIESLNEKVNALNDALSNKADSDLANAVVSGSTLVVGGYINTDVIDVDKLIVNKLKAVDIYGNVFNLDSDGLNVTDSDGVDYFKLYAANNSAWISFRNKEYESGMSAMNLHLTSGTGGVSINSNGISFHGNASLHNLKLGYIAQPDDVGYGIDTDFFIISKDLLLFDPVECRGKVLCIRTVGEQRIYSNKSNIYPRNSNTPTNTLTRNNSSQFFINDGTNWYEFYCG